MKTNGHETLKKGMRVIYRGSWGHDAPKVATVESIELCECENEKYGELRDEVPAGDIRRCVVDLDDNHWAYGWQIEEILG